LSAAAVVDRFHALSGYACRLLFGRYQPVEPPIRAELFGAQRFEQYGHSLACAEVVQRGSARGDTTPFFRGSTRTLNLCVAVLRKISSADAGYRP